MKMKLYGSVISPFTRMCLVTAHEIGLKDALHFVEAEVRPAEVNTELSKLSPIGKIPVLETDHGHAVYDSRVIMEYLAHHAGEKNFFPSDGVKRFRVLTLLALAQGTCDAAVAKRYEQVQRPEAMRWPEYRTRLRQRMETGLDEIERDWLDDLSSVHVGSVGVACMLGYIDYRHDALKWRSSRPHLAAFATRFNKRMSMEAWPLA
jgi:glutathione S-transferase